MAPLFCIIALIIQTSLTYASDDFDTHQNEGREILKNIPFVDDEASKDPSAAKSDWMNVYLGPNSPASSSSATLMAHVLNSDKTPTEQVEGMKEMANTITLLLQNEIANVLSYALSTADKEGDENNLNRKRRSIESPAESSQLVMRLLKHIKANNEYQNVAIEKMMSAQEIADKFGIDFNPDPEMLNDLAFSANEQTHELTSIIKDACTTNTTQQTLEFIPLETSAKTRNDSTYYAYNINSSPGKAPIQQNVMPGHQNVPQHFHNRQMPINHVHNPEPPRHNYYYNPYETQIPPPPVRYEYPPVSQRPTFYETVAPQEHYTQYCAMEPITTTTTIVLPYEEPVLEPELVGEEYEEAMSSKVFVNHEDPEETVVNHVMTYTITEKSHFRPPQIEKLPQQMQYTFFL